VAHNGGDVVSEEALENDVKLRVKKVSRA